MSQGSITTVSRRYPDFRDLEVYRSMTAQEVGPSGVIAANCVL